jgi:hypothetical protein
MPMDTGYVRGPDQFRRVLPQRKYAGSIGARLRGGREPAPFTVSSPSPQVTPHLHKKCTH